VIHLTAETTREAQKVVVPFGRESFMCEENTKLQGVVEHADNELSLHELEIVSAGTLRKAAGGDASGQTFLAFKFEDAVDKVKRRLI
jgi:hypothetical protein